MKPHQFDQLYRLRKDLEDATNKIEKMILDLKTDTTGLLDPILTELEKLENEIEVNDD